MASSPYRIVLVNMPCAPVAAPSLGLTQLKGALERRFGSEIAVELLYLNLHFTEFLGDAESYELLISPLGRLTGLADWLFRQVAFPEADDNTEDYLARYYFDEEDEEVRQVRMLIRESRPRLADFLDGLIERYRLDVADVVGFTLLFHQTVASFALARRIKARNPAVVTLAGGAACEAVMGMEYARQVTQIDFVFSGPALVSLPEFIGRRVAGDLAGCGRIPGVFAKGNLAGSGAMTGEECDINENTELDYDSFLNQFEATFPGCTRKPVLLFETSRGCRWGEKIACSFCGLNGTAMAYRAMSPGGAASLLTGLFRYGSRSSFLQAVDTLLPTEYLESLFPRLRPPEGLVMMYEVRSTLNAAQLDVLCRAGVRVIQPGIEALSTSTLRLMRKGATAFSNLRFLRDCSRMPMRVDWLLLIGSPGESENTWRKYLSDLPLLYHLPPPVGAFPISYDRFSRYFDEAGAFGLDLEPREFYRWVFPFAPEALRDIAYHFIDRNDDRERLNAWLDKLNALIGEWKTRWGGKAQLQWQEDGGEWLIYDSRGDRAVWREIAPEQGEVLEYLDTPRSAEQIDGRFGAARAREALDFLRGLRLLFEEDGRLMSLVVR